MMEKDGGDKGMAVALWAVQVNRALSQEETAFLLDRLPAERRERLLRVRHREQWREPLCAYALLRLAVYRRYGWTELPEISFTEKGKPVFGDQPNVHFSISHTNGGALVGLSDFPVGVDLEKLRPVGPRVQKRLDAAGETAEEYFQQWTLHEASVKRIGSDAASLLARERTEGAVPIAVMEGYVAAAAGQGPLEGPWLVSAEDLFFI